MLFSRYVFLVKLDLLSGVTYFGRGLRSDGGAIKLLCAGAVVVRTYELDTAVTVSADSHQERRRKFEPVFTLIPGPIYLPVLLIVVCVYLPASQPTIYLQTIIYLRTE